MIALILHKDDELELIRFQKAFISQNNSNNHILYAVHPLHIVLDFTLSLSSEQLKDYASKITKVQIDVPAWNNQKSQLSCSVAICFEGKEIQTELPLVRTVGTEQTVRTKGTEQTVRNSTFSGQKKEVTEPAFCAPPSSWFPKTINIFRLADKINMAENCSAVVNSVWKKLHN